MNAATGTLDCSDKGTIERLYAKLVRAVIAKAQSVVGRHDVAAEIAHDAFIKLWQKGGQFPNEKAVYVWLYKTSHRAAIDHVRSAAHRRESYNEENDSVLDAVASPARSDTAIDKNLVLRLLAQLEPDEAEAFVYVTLDGMTQAEVVDLMGVSRRTVQRLLERAETKFREARKA
jgi:RNA polymerase sigma-70 factor (ECF subfamily)